MSGLGLNFLIAVTYALLMGHLGLREMTTGFLVGLIILNLFPRALNAELYVARGRAVSRFLTFFFKSLLIANVQVALMALQRRPKLTPLIIDVPLKFESQAMQTLLVATITLLPGTVAMGFSADRSVMYAHSIGISDPVEVRSSIIEVEYYILDIMFPLDYPGGHKQALERAAERATHLAAALTDAAKRAGGDEALSPAHAAGQQEQRGAALSTEHAKLQEIVDEVKQT
ncbi:MAG: Na+/H+ antiporter subunit E [Deinococcus sp.]|nr:Na+/H+ antiporter subunit E [Deinococcus sp.]